MYRTLSLMTVRDKESLYTSKQISVKPWRPASSSRHSDTRVRRTHSNCCVQGTYVIYPTVQTMSADSTQCMGHRWKHCVEKPLDHTQKQEL
jgi:hypothetical protein